MFSLKSFIRWMHKQKVTKLDCEDYFFPKLTKMGSKIWPQKIRFLMCESPPRNVE